MKNVAKGTDKTVFAWPIYYGIQRWKKEGRQFSCPVCVFVLLHLVFAAKVEWFSFVFPGLTDGKIPLLKAPLHTLYIDMYRKIFPTAKFIFTYRNIYEMVGSGCSIFREVIFL